MINKFQQGGIIAQIQQLPKEQQQQIMQAFSQWAQQKGLDINQLQNDPQILEQALGQFMQEMQSQQTRAARHGAKLQYLKSLKNQCAEDEELYYYKKGGSVGCGCKKKEDGGEVNKAKEGSAVDKFKSARKMKPGGKSELKNNKKKINRQSEEDYNKGVTNEAEAVSSSSTKSTSNNSNIGKLDPRTTKTLPRGKYPSNWTSHDRQTWERLHGDNDEGAAVVKNKGIGKNCNGSTIKFKKHSSGGFIKADKNFELDPIGYTDFLNQNGINPKRVAAKYVYTDVVEKGGKVKKDKTCPKCGKVHTGNCSVAKFKKHRQGGSLNGIPFIRKGLLIQE